MEAFLKFWDRNPLEKFTWSVACGRRHRGQRLKNVSLAPGRALCWETLNYGGVFGRTNSGGRLLNSFVAPSKRGFCTKRKMCGGDAQNLKGAGGRKHEQFFVAKPFRLWSGEKKTRGGFSCLGRENIRRWENIRGLISASLRNEKGGLSKTRCKREELKNEGEKILGYDN